MAVVIPLKDIPDDKIQIIMTSLTMVPVDEREERMMKQRKHVYSKAKEPVIMYLIENDTIKLPYKFACGMFNKVFNNGQYHQIINDQILFTATLREHQVPQALEAYRYLTEQSTVILGLPPGEGKTILGMWLAYHLRLMFLVIVPREKLLGQWYKTIEKSIPGILNNIWIPGENNVSPMGIICMNTRTHLIPQHIKDSVGTLIIDEAHMLCTPTMVKSLLCVTPKYIIIETATLERTDKMESMIYSMVGSHGLFKVSDKPYQIVKVELDIEVPTIQNSYGTDYVDMIKKLALNDAYNTSILDIIRSNPQRKFIVLGKLKDHIMQLHLWLKQLQIKSDILIGDKNDYTDSTVLLGTMSKIGVGFDESTSCLDFKGIESNTLILLPSVREWQSFEQYRGRIMRCKNIIPIVVWLNIKNSSIRNHLSGLKRWIEGTNGSIITKVFRQGEIILP